MAIKITWGPSTDTDIASYTLETANAASGPWSSLVTVVHNLAGANYTNGSFFYDHAEGTSTTWYRIFATDAAAQNSPPSSPFQVPVVGTTVAVDHNYGSANSLRYQTAGGAAIDNAVVRIFRKSDFDAGNTSGALATTRTTSTGTWVNPIYLPSGFTYTIQFSKEGLYGPDKIDVIV